VGSMWDQCGINVGSMWDQCGINVVDCNAHLVVKGLKDRLLHLQNFLLAVCAVANVHKVPQFGGVNLLVLGSNEEASHADKLELGTRHLISIKVTIDEVNGKVKGLRNKLELKVNLDCVVAELCGCGRREAKIADTTS